MSLYITIKIIHILSVCMTVGATLCNGVLHLQAYRSSNPAKMSVMLGNIMVINRLIMAPSFLLIPVSGALLAYLAQFAYSEIWLWGGILLTLVLFLGFMVGYKIENRMETIIAEDCAQHRERPTKQYYETFKRAAPIGASATLFSLIIIYLMIAKP